MAASWPEAENKKLVVDDHGIGFAGQDVANLVFQLRGTM